METNRLSRKILPCSDVDVRARKIVRAACVQFVVSFASAHSRYVAGIAVHSGTEYVPQVLMPAKCLAKATYKCRML